MKLERIFGNHIRLSHPDKSEKDYSLDFPNQLLYSIKDKENFSKSSGQHMKTDKYKKMFSEMFSGKNNINHSSRTTDDERKSRSPFSKKFYIDRGYSEEFAINKISNFAKMDKNHSTTLKYWLDKTGDDIDLAKKLLKERQSTFSLEKCKQKYGEEEGFRRWKDRQDKWLNNYKKNNFSKISQILFNELYNIIKFDFNEIYFATLNTNKEIDLSCAKNYEYRLLLNDRMILPDFLINDIKTIIEFDGAYWHNKHFVNSTNKTRDQIRDTSIIGSGYSVFHVKELEYKSNPKKIIDECLQFIYDKKDN